MNELDNAQLDPTSRAFDAWILETYVLVNLRAC